MNDLRLKDPTRGVLLYILLNNPRKHSRVVLLRRIAGLGKRLKADAI
jgi:hypothetical protein